MVVIIFNSTKLSTFILLISQSSQVYKRSGLKIGIENVIFNKLLWKKNPLAMF